MMEERNDLFNRAMEVLLENVDEWDRLIEETVRDTFSVKKRNYNNQNRNYQGENE